jgi:hypothetical protein
MEKDGVGERWSPMSLGLLLCTRTSYRTLGGNRRNGVAGKVVCEVSGELMAAAITLC